MMRALNQRIRTVCFIAGSILIAVPIVSRAQAITPRPGTPQPIRLTKPRILPLPEALWTEVHRKLVGKYSRDGRVGNDLRTLLNVPGIVESIIPFRNYISTESSLSPRHRELLILRTAWLCGNDYLWGTHATLAKMDLSANEIRQVARGPSVSGWDPFEANLLRMADELYTNSSVSDTTWQIAVDKYDMYHMMDAVYTVADFTMLSLMYNSMGIQPDPWITEHLPTDVPYRVVVPSREPPLKVPRIQSPDANPGGLYKYLRQGAEPRSLNTLYLREQLMLPPRVREMLILRSLWNSRDEYEWGQHTVGPGRGRSYGLDPARIAAGPGAIGWDSFDSILLRSADELYRDAIISDNTWQSLATRYDTTKLMEVLLAVASYRMIAMPLNAFGVQLNPGAERFPVIQGQ